jgi:hypothetical protein
MNEKPLDNILRAMRGNEFDDPHIDAEGIIGARNICRDFADKIEAALHDPQQVLNVLAQFHDENYSVFPRDQLTERLCHAFYGEFVKDPDAEA